MKKILLIAAAMAFLFAGVVLAGQDSKADKKDKKEKSKKEKTEEEDIKYTERVDLSLYAQEFEGWQQSLAAQGLKSINKTAAADAGINSVAVGIMAGGLKPGTSIISGIAQQGIAQQQAVPTGLVLEFDWMGIKRGIDSGNIDLTALLAIGSYDIFGSELILSFNNIDKQHFDAFALSFDAALSIFPFGSSPSGWYISGIIGMTLYNYSLYNGVEEELWPGLNIGAQSGFRLVLGFFAIDAGVTYKQVVSIPMSDTHQAGLFYDIIYRIGAGFAFGDAAPAAKEEIKAEKVEKNEK